MRLELFMKSDILDLENQSIDCIDCAVITNDNQYFKLISTAADFPKSNKIYAILEEIIGDVAMLIDKKGISELEHLCWLEISQKDYFDLIINEYVFSKEFNILKYWKTYKTGCCLEHSVEISKCEAERYVLQEFYNNYQDLQIFKNLNDDIFGTKFHILEQNYCNRYLDFFRKNNFFNCGEYSISYGAFPNINCEKSYTYTEII